MITKEEIITKLKQADDFLEDFEGVDSVNVILNPADISIVYSKMRMVRKRLKNALKLLENANLIISENSVGVVLAKEAYTPNEHIHKIFLNEDSVKKHSTNKNNEEGDYPDFTYSEKKWTVE